MRGPLSPIGVGFEKRMSPVIFQFGDHTKRFRIPCQYFGALLICCCGLHSPHTMPIINYVSLGILHLKKIATKKYFVLPKRFKNKRFINTILTLWFVNLVTFQSHDVFLRISCPIFIKIQSHNNLITFRIRRSTLDLFVMHSHV